MKEIRDEGILNVSQELASKLKVNNGDEVKIITEFGEIVQKVIRNPELKGDMARITLNKENSYYTKHGINPCISYLSAKIEKY